MISLIVKRGPNLSLTQSTIRFDQYGSPTGLQEIVCDSWQEGYQLAKQTDNHLALFIEAGTVFVDIEEFLADINNYPHQGLVGHIIDPLTSDYFYLHPQCFLIDLDIVELEDFEIGDFISRPVKRSSENNHDDYTPLWITYNVGNNHTWQGKQFGERIIARLINDGRIVSNFSNGLRKNKIFLYPNEPKKKEIWLEQQQKYLGIAKSQLWILNNEPTPIGSNTDLITPASGLCWLTNLVNKKVKTITLVDISQSQLDFAKELLASWNGKNFGNFVFDYMKQNKILNFMLDNVSLTKEEKLNMLKTGQFQTYLNTKFEEQLPNFTDQWSEAKTKTVNIVNADVIKWLPSQQIAEPTDIWLSNILDYKYTLINNTDKELDDFQTCLKNTSINLL